MAGADYKHCDVCGAKAFYDSNLNYEQGEREWYTTDYDIPFNEVGEPQLDDPESLKDYGLRLDYLGDWAVLCHKCAKTHKCVIVPREE